jgi:hypothetical protein
MSGWSITANCGSTAPCATAASSKCSAAGLLLSLIRWNPDAVWALTSQTMATHGHLNRMGFNYLERGFFRWQWGSDDMDAVEWIAIAERRGLEQMVEEMLTTPQQSRQA